MTLSNKERYAIPRQDMPTQDAHERAANFEEVALGLTWEAARLEAQRCIQCKNPHCVDGCPVGVRIPDVLLALGDGDLAAAVDALTERNSLPAVCGRVCPQESQCEARCTLGAKHEPVAIGRLERFLGDHALQQHILPAAPLEHTGRRVAVVGSGPSGLTCAVDLAKLGHAVTIFESLHLPGGVLAYGIPEFRLPRSIITAEVRTAVEHLNIELRTDHVIGTTYTLVELREDYDAVFLGTGAGLPAFMDIPGTNLNGVFSANELLTRVNLMRGYAFPEYDTPVKAGERVAVIGAGNVAMDAARSALRLQRLRAAAHPQTGPGEVHVVYRRSEAEVPARREEYTHAVEEGVVFDFLTNPVAVLGDGGRVTALRCVRMELGEPDESGRRRPRAVAGSELDLVADTVIFALGTSPNPLVFTGAANLDRSRWGTVLADEATGRTHLEGVWAGGDVVTGAATVISAMGAGKAAAADMHTFLLAHAPKGPSRLEASPGTVRSADA